MSILSYNDKSFILDGEPFVIRSGAMHYFRIPREYWYDRLLKLKECGFNTVETYICWNLHEEREGEYNFSGMLDLVAYIKTAEKLGLYVILRPGPFICAEWEAGGLPTWLTGNRGLSLRCNDELYLAKVRRYLYVLFDKVRPCFSTNGGNVIMVQLENEYGSYGNDKDYLKVLAGIYRECGVDVLIFTADGTDPSMLNGGTLDGYLCAANFGSKPAENFAALDNFRKGQPKMCGEFWCGWFDHWHHPHHFRDASETAGAVDEILSAGASVNVYMFHGGTNFGFMNGANEYDGEYYPTVTSYDYGALLSESGDMTPAYYAVRKVMEKHSGTLLPPLTAKNSEKMAYGKVTLTEKAFLLDVCGDLTDPVFATAPKSQEDLGQNVGFTLYSTVVKGPLEELALGYDMLHDRAVVYCNGKTAGIIERDKRQDIIKIALGRDESVKIDILVENMGRINYGVNTADRKGMTGIRFGIQRHFGWNHYPLEMRDLSPVTYRHCNCGVEGSHFLKGTLLIKGEPKDTFIRLDDFHHGFVTVNGFNIGRYYTDAGPQKTLYCPAPVLRNGENEIIVFETDGSESNCITFTDTPELG